MKGVLDRYRDELDKGIYEGLKFIHKNKGEILQHYPKSVLPELTLNTYIYHHWDALHMSGYIEEQLRIIFDRILHKEIMWKSDIQIFKNFINSIEKDPEYFAEANYNRRLIKEIKGIINDNK